MSQTVHELALHDIVEHLLQHDPSLKDLLAETMRQLKAKVYTPPWPDIIKQTPYKPGYDLYDAYVFALVVYLQPAGNSDRPPIRYNAPFTTGVRGLCHGIQPCFLPVGADCLGVVVSHALLVVAIGVRSRSTDTTHASDATPQTLHSTQTLSGSRPQAPLRRL